LGDCVDEVANTRKSAVDLAPRCDFSQVGDLEERRHRGPVGVLDPPLALDRIIGGLGGVIVAAETSERVGEMADRFGEERDHLVRRSVGLYAHDFHLTHEILRS